MTREEKEIIEVCERLKHRPLTKQEANLAIAQARLIGEISDEEAIH